MQQSESLFLCPCAHPLPQGEHWKAAECDWKAGITAVAVLAWKISRAIDHLQINFVNCVLPHLSEIYSTDLIKGVRCSNGAVK